MALLNYAKLFNVALRHDFYTGGITHDFDITPTKSTQQLFKNNKLIFKKDNTGFRVMYRKSSTPPPDSFVNFANIELRFGMTMKNITEFLNFSNLDKSPTKTFKAGNIMYFTNTNVTTHKLKYEILDELKPNQFMYEFPQTSLVDTGSIEIKNEAGTVVTPASPPGPPFTGIQNVNGKFFYPVDLSHLPPGMYSFKTTVGTNNKTKDFYIDNELITAGICGVIKIKAQGAANTDWPPASGGEPARQYFTDLIRRETKWRFIVVPKLSGIPAASLTVVDAVINPLPYNPGSPQVLYAFTNITSPPAPVVNGVQAIVYESTTLIPFYEKAKTGLRVMNGATIVQDNVNNPAQNVISALSTDFNTTIIYVIV